MQTTSTWSSPSPGPVLWTTAPANTWQTDPTSMEPMESSAPMTSWTLTSVSPKHTNMHTFSHPYHTHRVLKPHLPICLCGFAADTWLCNVGLSGLVLAPLRHLLPLLFDNTDCHHLCRDLIQVVSLHVSESSLTNSSEVETLAIQPQKLLILDARSYAAAVANRAKGGGCECPGKMAHTVVFLP